MISKRQTMATHDMEVIALQAGCRDKVVDDLYCQEERKGH